MNVFIFEMLGQGNADVKPEGFAGHTIVVDSHHRQRQRVGPRFLLPVDSRFRGNDGWAGPVVCP